MEYNQVDIAIIDGNINNIFNKDIYKKTVLGFTNADNDTHATMCYLILKKYAPNFRCSNVSLLGSNDGKDILNLYSSLEWCLENNIFIVNLSFGTTHFKDYKEIQKTVNYFSNKGMILICASSNAGLTTYPASLSTVIGVVTNKECIGYKSIIDINLGVDIVAQSIHEIDVLGENILTSYSNSYATPYVTAQIANIISKHNYHYDIRTLKRHILGECYQEPFTPDWISSAYIVGNLQQTKATCYFSSTKNAMDIDTVDTIIVCDPALLNFKICNKNLVLLNEKNKLSLMNDFNDIGFYWSPLCKERQIKQTIPSSEQIPIPMIHIVVEDSVDKFFLMTELQSFFSNKGYNSYTICTEPQCVLYSLEYIPISFFTYPNELINSFLYEQIKYRQNDLIILCTQENIEKIEFDVRINITRCEKNYIFTLESEDAFFIKLTVEENDLNIAALLSQELIKILI